MAIRRRHRQAAGALVIGVLALGYTSGSVSADPVDEDGFVACNYCTDNCPANPSAWCAERWCSPGGLGSKCENALCLGVNGQYYSNRITCPTY
jgi:hypothetical protein